MKKILGLIVAVAILIPMTVRADMGAPQIVPYEMVVVSESGIKYYSYDDKLIGTIPKDDKYKVIYEYNNEYTIQYKNEEFEVRSLEGSILYKDEYDPETTKDNDVQKTNSKALIYLSDVPILKGPANIYDKIGTIPKGEIVKYTYRVLEGGYIYVEYNGKKGWIDTLNGKVLTENSENIKYIFKEDYHTSCATIPKNTILTPDYYTDTWTGKARFTYKNCTDLVSTFKSDRVFDIYPHKAESKKELSIYEFANDEGKKIATIPKNTQFISIASADFYDEGGPIFIKYGDVRGWINVKEGDYEIFYDKDDEVSESDALTPEEIAGKDKKEIVSTKDKEQPTTGEKSEKKSIKKVDDYVLTYVIIGGSLAIAAIIVIILVNKNRKLKKQLKEDEQKLADIEEDNKE